MNKKLYLGITLIFISGMMNSGVLGMMVVSQYDAIDQETHPEIIDDLNDVIVSKEIFYNNILYYALYSSPLIVLGLFLIRKSQQ